MTGLDFAYELLKVMMRAVVAKGGNLQHLARIVREPELQERIADLIVTGIPDTEDLLGEDEHLVHVRYAMPSKKGLLADFSIDSVSELLYYGSYKWQKHSACADMSEVDGDRVMLLKKFNGRSTVDTIPPSDPVITPAAGAYSSAQSIFISSAGSNSIRYTTNGSEPSCSAGTSYAGSFALASTASVKAIGCDLAKNASNVTTNAYTISAGGGGNSSNNNPNIGGSGGLALLSGPTIFQIYYNGQYLTKAQYDALFPQAAPEVQPPAQTEVPQPASVPDSASKPSLQNPSLLTTAQLLAVFDLTPNPEEESKILPLVGADAKEFGLVLSDALARATRDFIVYGISPNTIKSGEGERRAIIRDYMDTVGRDYFVWSDIEKITNGQIPVKRSIEKERAMAPEALKAFRHAFGHDPDFKNTKENLAWNTMMYRIRFPRELAKEQQGIIAFYKTYGHNPKTPFDWSVVRVLGYVI